LAFFLVDETLGFAIAAREAVGCDGRPSTVAVERTLLVSGIDCYLAWQAGTRANPPGRGRRSDHPGEQLLGAGLSSGSLDDVVGAQAYRIWHLQPEAPRCQRFGTRWNTLGCSTGKSPGLVPFRMRSTYTAARRNHSLYC
jgi:hypothetical protein